MFEPIDMLHIIGQDPLNDFQAGATYYIATGDSGQGTCSIKPHRTMLLVVDEQKLHLVKIYVRTGRRVRVGGVIQG